MKLMIEKYYWFLLGIILAFAFSCRVYQVGNIKSYIFDEVYHAVTAKLISRNDPRAFEWWNPPPEPATAVDWLHPPLAKYTQAASILIFGETPFGWRFSSVIFGTLVIAMTAILAQELFQDKRISLLAGGLAALDGLLLVQSRIAMNDIHVTFFILLTLWLYLRYRRSRLTFQLAVQPNQPKLDPLDLGKNLVQKRPLFWLFLTGTSAGLAMASKWSGIFALAVIWLYELRNLGLQFRSSVRNIRDQRLLASRMTHPKASNIGNIFSSTSQPATLKNTLLSLVSQITKLIFYLALLPYCIYVMSYMQMYLQGKSLACEEDFVQQGTCYCMQNSSWWVEGLKKILPQNAAAFEKLEARGGCKQLISHYWELQHQIWWYQTNLKATHPYQSRPLQWFLDVRPVWMYVKYGDGSIANIYAEGNPLLFWAGDVAVFVTFCFLQKQLFQKRSATRAADTPEKKTAPFTQFVSVFPVGFVFLAYLMVWLPWEISPRIMFFYHYTPAVPLLCILLGYWLVKAQNYRAVVAIGGRRLKVTRLLLWFTLLSIGVTYVVFYPNWTGMPVPTWVAQTFYYLLPSWK